MNMKLFFQKFFAKVSMYMSCHILDIMYSISFDKIKFYTEILFGKVELVIFPIVSLMKKISDTL